MRWLDGITYLMDMSLNNASGVGDRQGSLVSAVHWVAESRTQLRLNSLGIWFANISSHSIDYLLIFLFLLLQLFSLMQPNLLIFAFVACVFGAVSKKLLPGPISRNFFRFSSRSFAVSGLQFLVSFKLSFVNDTRQRSNFIFMHVVNQFSQHHLLERTSFPH